MVKYTKISRERMDYFLSEHGSSISEAAKIAGISRSTLTRYLAKGLVPTEWVSAIRETLRDRKPTVRTKTAKVVLCTACGKDISDDNCEIATNSIGIKKLTAKVPTSGYYWSPVSEEPGAGRQKMFRICAACSKKLDKLHKVRPKKVVKAKITVKHD